MKYFSIFLAVVFTVVTILNFMTRTVHYCRLAFIIHIMIILIAGAVLIDFILVRCKKDIKLMLIRTGVLFYVVTSLVDLVMFYVDRVEAFDIDKGSKTITLFGLYIFIILLLLSYAFNAMEYFISEKEKKRLEELAHIDVITGVFNRNSCIEYMDKLNDAMVYTIGFFDVNNLKRANDEYGHDVGDRLICYIARMLKSEFEDIGFVGRYGGDEFLVCIEKNYMEQFKCAIDNIKVRIDEDNRNNLFPFEVSAAYGFACNLENETATAKDVLRIADERMYERKRMMKESR